MSEVHYEIVQHDGGWAYKVGDVFSETFSSHEEAFFAAKSAAGRQELAGSPEEIEFQDERGKWHLEHAEGSDRPEADVVDSPAPGASH
jgi:hypothetical protein